MGASNTAPKAPQKEKDATTLPGGVGASATASEMAAAMAASMSGIRVPAFWRDDSASTTTTATEWWQFKRCFKAGIVVPILRNKEVRDRLLKFCRKSTEKRLT